MDEAWLGTVRIARDAGDISSLFPPGITRLVDLPHTLHTAIRMALHFLEFEKLSREEQPPKRIWLDREKMAEWFREVERSRDAKYNPDHIDTSGMTENQLVKDMIVGGDFG